MCSGVGNTDVCFNPCFDGSVARGPDAPRPFGCSTRFNPCFDGSVARGTLAQGGHIHRKCVSILVLMEV